MIYKKGDVGVYSHDNRVYLILGIIEVENKIKYKYLELSPIEVIIDCSSSAFYNVGTKTLTYENDNEV